MTSYRPNRPAGVPPEGYARNLRLIELDRLVPSYQLTLVPERLAAITAAIRNGEALDAIVVRPGRDDCFLIVGGHHRVAASRDLGFSHIPALVETVWQLQCCLAQAPWPLQVRSYDRA